jgi:dipeptidyl aminopeptidase/acylaminoacyl peptidase
VKRSDIHRQLRDVPIPDEHGARERGWRVVRAGFAGHRPPTHAARVPARLGIAIALAALALVLVLTPAGAKVVDAVRDVVEPGAENARPTLTSLPAPGNLLVTSPEGAWIVHRDGSKRLLGPYEDATWSPSGLYVAVTRGRELTAVDPVGSVRWSVPSERPVSDPAWSPSGIRVAYLSGTSLRIVVGDGSDDHLLANRVAKVAPVWRPLRKPVPVTETVPGTNVVTYVDRDGRVTLRDAVSGRVLWRTHPYGPPIRALEWSADRTRVLVRTDSFVDFLDTRGRTVSRVTMPTIDASMSPDGSQVAFVRRTKSEDSRLLVIGRDGGGAPQSLLSGPGRITTPTWSPDGNLLLVAWPDADQWIFNDPAHPRRVDPVGRISRQFDPGATGRPSFPQIRGWCCAR